MDASSEHEALNPDMEDNEEIHLGDIQKAPGLLHESEAGSENLFLPTSVAASPAPGDVPVLTKANCVNVDVDEVWNFLGKYGRYQVVSIVLLLVALAAQAFAILSGVFVGMSIDHKCDSQTAASLSLPQFPNGSRVVEGECSVQVVLNSSSGPQVLHKEKCFEFEYEAHTSYLAEWNLVCSRETLGQLPQMLTMIGMMVGAVTLPNIGDRYGRKVLGLGSQLAHLAVCIGLAYSPTFELFVILKFLSGAFNQGFMITHYIHLMELLPTDMRTMMGVLASFVWVMSVIYLVPIAYIFMGYHWRTMQLAYSLVSLTSLALLFLDESLRWLLINRKAKRANAILKKACRWNGKSYENLMKRILKENEAETNGNTQPLHDVPEIRTHVKWQTEQTAPAKAAKTTLTFKDVLVCKTMRNISFIVIYAWMVNSLTYYGITLLSTSLAGDPYINFLIGAVLELPSTAFMFFLLKRFGRKTVVMTLMSGAGIALLSAVLLATLSDNSYSLSLVQTGLTLFGKFCIAASFNVMWLYTPELYPTNLRNVGVGMSSMGARIAASASPFFKILASKVIWAPGALFSGACFLCVFLFTFLPETSHRELPSTIAEVESWCHSDRQERAVSRRRKRKTDQFIKVQQGDEVEKRDTVRNRVV